MASYDPMASTSMETTDDDAPPLDTSIPDVDLCEECLLKVHKNSFNRNLLKNGFGNENQDHHCEFRYFKVNPRATQFVRMCIANNCPRFKFWNVVEAGGNGWWVEDEPEGSDPVPESLEHRSCFVTSYGFCSKQQVINLDEVGLTDRIMDEIRPDIEVSEWYAGRTDAGSIYFLKVSLLDSEMQIMHVYGERKKVVQGGGGSWHKVTFAFKDYEPGVRYLVFSHAGQDLHFWHGYYGSKMCGGSVVAKVPRAWFRRNSRSSQDSASSRVE